MYTQGRACKKHEWLPGHHGWIIPWPTQMKDCVPQKGPWLVTGAWKRNDGHVCPSPGFGQEREEDLVERCRVFLNLLGSQGTPVIRWVCQFFLAGCPWPFDSSDPVALTSSSISSLLNMSMLPIRKVGVNAFFIQPVNHLVPCERR